MIRKTIRRAKVKDVIGNRYSQEEVEKHKKYDLYTPENYNMTISNRGPLSVQEFERKLKQINPRLFIHYRPEKVRNPEEPYGHPIRFHDPLIKPEGYDFTGVACGKAGERLIPAMTTFNHFKNEDGDYITRYNSYGWESALDGVLEFLVRRGYSVSSIEGKLDNSIK